MDDPADKRTYRIFWCVVLVIKFAMDSVLIVHSLVAPSRAIMQIDLYCWNYNFAGEDCDRYDYTDALPGAHPVHARVSSLRLQVPHALRALAAQRDALLLQHVFFYLAALGFASAYDRLRWRGVADG